MTRLITGLEVYRYAPELNKLHLRNRQTLPVPGITTIQQTKARLFGRWQPGHQVTITVSHPDYINLSRLYRGATGKPERPPSTPNPTAPAPQRARHHHPHPPEVSLIMTTTTTNTHQQQPAAPDQPTRIFAQ
ncbi:hypothetical protein [Aeromonas veronii]|uniref:hypothetical protein n=1 Tax=Aeromonas veronii TaxID=654 RepID=UPI0035BB125F